MFFFKTDIQKIQNEIKFFSSFINSFFTLKRELKMFFFSGSNEQCNGMYKELPKKYVSNRN